MTNQDAYLRALVKELDLEALIPYSCDDVSRFLEFGDFSVGHVRFETLPGGIRLCDVAVHIPGQNRAMIWQGIRMSEGSISFPRYLHCLSPLTKMGLEGVIVQAWEESVKKAGNELNSMLVQVSPDGPLPTTASEFLIPGTAPYSSYIAHARRYLFASEFCNGRNVLDVGCGIGYGSRMLARVARGCCGLDISEEAIGLAECTYAAPNIKFTLGDSHKLGFKTSFDVVVCFGLLEHLDEQEIEECLAEMTRVVEPRGLLIVSVPNRRRREMAGARECTEPYRDEFYVMLSSLFGSENVRLFGQRRWDQSMPLADECAITESVSDENTDFIAVCCKPKESSEIRIFPMAKYKASIIVPVYGDVMRTQACLQAVAETIGDDLEYEVIIVNNSSCDSMREFLRGLEGDVRIINNNVEVGFGVACNQGADAATGEHLIFLSTDAVPLTGCLQSLVKSADGDPDIGVVGPMVLGADNTVKQIGLCFGDDCVPKRAFEGLRADDPQVLSLREVQAVGFPCVLVKGWLFQQIGGFAGSRFVHFEDADLCLRVREAGAKVLYCPEARVVVQSGLGVRSREVEMARRATFQAFLRRWKDRLVADAEQYAGRPRCTSGTPPLVWHGLVFGASGYADEARNFIFAIDGRWPIAIEPMRLDGKHTDLSPEEIHRLEVLSRACFEVPAIHVWHIQPHLFQIVPDGLITVGRTMFETDRIPSSWVEPCNLMGEIWVPCDFNIETFARSGVARDKLVKVPGAIDLRRFTPDVEPLDIPGRRGFNFLCNLDWRPNKGWDVLLKAYCEEFKPSEDVALIIKAYSASGKTTSMIHSEAKSLIESFGYTWGKTADIVFVDSILPSQAIPRLYAAADAYVLPTRGEGWGRTQMEAMGMELPTISTRWSGCLEFMNDDNSFLIDCDVVDVPESAAREIPSYRGHKWAEPRVEHLRCLMRRVFEDRDYAREVGMRARAELETKYTRERVADLIINHLMRIAAERR